MKSRRFVAPLALFVLVGCNAGDAVVGGACREGFSEANGACTKDGIGAPTSTDSSPSSYTFANGTATLLGADDPSAVDPANGQVPSGGAGSATSPSGEGDASTADPADPTPVVPIVCEGSLVACHGECIPVASDAANCGACGKICPSNICIEGECQGALAGDVIALGHDASSPYAKMVANALSIATTDPIRVLAFDAADPSAAAERSAIASSIRFRSVAWTVASAADLEATDLAKSFDVVLVQHAGDSASYLGARSRGSLETFTKRGGIVVALDDGASDVPAFLRDSGLLAVEGHATLSSGSQIVVSAPNDALGMQVLSPYAPSGSTVGFVGVASSADVTVVARANDESALPTAVHRFVR